MTKPSPQTSDAGEDRRRWSRRPESRPAEILKAAFAVFAEAGYERTTIADVGKRAGVSPALVVHYFGTKAELFAAVIQDRFAQLRRGGGGAAGLPPRQLPRPAAQLVRRFWEHLWEPGSIELALAVKAERAKFPECARTAVAARRPLARADRRRAGGRTAAGRIRRVGAAHGPGHQRHGRGGRRGKPLLRHRGVAGTVAVKSCGRALVAFLDHGVLAAQGESQ